MNLKTLSTALVAIIAIALTNAIPVEASDAKANIDKAWKWNLDGFSIDPNSWTDTWKTKMTHIGVICGYMVALQFPLAQVGGVGLISVGLVKMNWSLVAAICATLYGFKTNKKIFLGIGAIASYCLAFGYQLV
jgi:hypothetical protein